MIDLCPIRGKTPEPVKASYEAWSINCCGLSAVDPCFMDVLIKWRDLVATYERVKP